MPFFTFIALLMLSCAVYGTPIENPEKQVVDEFWLYTDNSHHFNSQSVLHNEDSQWQHLVSQNINLGYQNATVWLKFTLTNATNLDALKILDINYPLLDYVNLYEIKETGRTTELMNTGDSLPYHSRELDHPNFTVPLTLKAGVSHTFLLKIKSNAPIQTEVIAWSPDRFQSYYRTKASLTFLYLGILLSTALFNLVVFIFIKEKMYLAYGLYAGCFALLMTTQDAILFEYIFPNKPAYHNWSQLFLGALTISLTCIFNLLFLQLSTKGKGKPIYLLSLIPLFILLSAFLAGYAFAIKALVISILIIIPTVFILGFFYSKENENRSFYLIAWTWLFVGVLIFALARLGLLPFNLFTNHAIQLGSALELLTFAIALAKRLHTEKETRIEAQQIIIDSTRRSAKLQQELLYNATHNDISGLPNRNFFTGSINAKINSQESFSVVLLRLSRIAELDKTLGREISNYVLEQFATLLNSEVQSIKEIECIDTNENFFACNLSNSTLALILNSNKRKKINLILIKLSKAINQPIKLNQMEIDPWINLGYATFPDHGDTAQTLLRNAGIALDNAQHAENHICNYHESLDTYNERRLVLMNELKSAIAHNQMTLFYQPLINTNDSKIIGAEALIRWPHPEYGTIMPDEFIEVAEQTGIIQALSLWVIKTAFQQLRSWIKVNPDFLMSINVSTQNIQDKNFIIAISFLVEENKHLANNIILEITETQMMSDTQHALENLWKLHELGLKIAIDDFGTGYSNLGYLKKLPASELKIDKMFVINLEDDKQNQTLVQTAIQMAHNFGLKVVAEGVESERSQAILKDMGCDMCQGFHISRPVNAEKFTTLLNSAS